MGACRRVRGKQTALEWVGLNNLLTGSPVKWPLDNVDHGIQRPVARPLWVLSDPRRKVESSATADFPPAVRLGERLEVPNPNL